MKKLLGLIILRYLRFLARLQLRKNPNATIVGITGSAGKTSTRKAVTLILRLKGRVKESIKANSESGIPLNILGIKPHNFSSFDWLRMLVVAPFKLLFNWEQYQYYVVEMGIDSPHPPKNMEYLLSIIKPDIGIVLNAGLVHAAAFDALVSDNNPSRRQVKLIKLIAAEKGKLVTSLNGPNIAILNADQKEVLGLAKQTKARVITFGKKGGMVRISQVSQKKEGFCLSVTYHGRVYPLCLSGLVLESSYAHTLAAALSVAVAVGIPLPKAISAIEAKFSTPPGRFRLFPGVNNSFILDSSYNASPATMQSALKTLSRLAGKKYKIAVLGDMRELGTIEKQAHKDLATWAAANADEVFLLGTLTGEHTLPILSQKKVKVHHFTSMDNLINDLVPAVKKDAYLLFKGSQNTIFLERAVEAVLADKNDVDKLCRRGTYWDKVRKNAD